MTSLIFVTRDNASPLIHVEAHRSTVLTYLTNHIDRPDDKALSPSRAAIWFLCALPQDGLDWWNPKIESAPVFGVDDLPNLENPDDTICWDPIGWREVVPEPDSGFEPEPVKSFHVEWRTAAAREMENIVPPHPHGDPGDESPEIARRLDPATRRSAPEGFRVSGGAASCAPEAGEIGFGEREDGA